MFCGMQSQNSGCSVEDKIKKALKSIGIDSKIEYAGRTDRGVHALGQVVSFELPIYWDSTEKLKNELSKNLAPYIIIRRIFFTDDTFHARFSAKKREYIYIINPTAQLPFYNNYILQEELDVQKIKSAIPHFIGRYDFEYFMLMGSEPSNTIREVYSASIYKHRGVYIISFCANGFLRSQVRLMVGFLLQISRGVLSEEDLVRQLNKDHLIFRKPISPSGLYLKSIYY